MVGDAVLGAEFFDRAAATKGRDRPTEVLAERNEQIIEFDPVAFREFLPEGHFGFFRGLGFDVSQPIRNPVDMGIDTDPGLVKAKGHNKIGRFPPHSL